MTIPRFFVSLDIGGSKTSGVLIDWPNGTHISLAVPSKNLRAMVDLELGELILRVQKQIKDFFGVEKSTWLIGAAGARPDEDTKRISQILHDVGVNIEELFIYRDFEANHAAALFGDDGIISVNGTGSVLFGKLAMNSARKGGWGYLLDEMPSGAAFGRWALQGLLMNFEGSIETDGFRDIYSKYFPDFPQDRSEIIDLLYASHSSQRVLGNFGSLLTKAYEVKSPWAMEKIAASISIWKSELVVLADQTGFGSPVPLSGIGGLWKGWDLFAGLARSALEKECPGRFMIREPRLEAKWGPFILYFMRKHDDFKTINQTIQEYINKKP